MGDDFVIYSVMASNDDLNGLSAKNLRRAKEKALEFQQTMP